METNLLQVNPEILDFIKSSRWRLAKTMPQWPHEYVLRTWRPDKEAAFKALVMLNQPEFLWRGEGGVA